MDAPRDPPVERALTAEQVAALKRDLKAAGVADFRAKVYTAMYVAGRVADNMASSVGQVTADQAFLQWQRHLVQHWGSEAMPRPEAPGLVLEPLTGDWAYLDAHGTLWRLHATGDAEIPFTIEQVSVQA